jgi:hypothetical protein
VRLAQKIAIAAGCTVLAGAIAYGELVLDWRTPRSQQPIDFALTGSASFLMADYNRLKSDMEQKYGEQVSVSVPVTGSPANKNGMAEVSLDGKVMETHSLRRLSTVTGMFIVSPQNPDAVRFPFKLDPNQNLATIDQGVVKELKEHFKRVPAPWFEFSDADWSIDHCSSSRAGLGLGIIGEVLHLQEGTSCVVTWKGKQPRSMLVFVGRADGNSWLRTFSERLCRSVTDSGLERLDAPTAKGLDYAACILGDQATREASQKALFGAVYAVGRDRRLEKLALI